jgi:sn-glycerol-1-phosphate dehydrogenase
MKPDNFNDVVEEGSSRKYIENLKQNVLLIYSPTSIEKNNIKNNQCLMVNWHDLTKKINKIDEFIKKNNTISSVVSYGGGSTIDIGKYIANKLGIDFICIPTMLSTNSYATDKVALIKENKKITLNAKIPDKIIIDNELLNLSKDENIYGLADVFSIYTALYDWKIAEKDILEKIDDNIYNMAEKLFKEVLEFVNNNELKDISENNIKLFQFIGTAGYITNLYGTGRPESGSEHILAKEIEKRVNIPHGISVSVGIIIMSIIQEQYNNNIVKSIMKLGILDKGKSYGLNLKTIADSLNNVKQRKDRYTIINRICSINNINGVLEKFENIIKENKVDLN